MHPERSNTSFFSKFSWMTLGLKDDVAFRKWRDVFIDRSGIAANSPRCSYPNVRMQNRTQICRIWASRRIMAGCSFSPVRRLHRYT